MSKADTMFEELGYEKDKDNKLEYEMINKDDKVIKINKETREIYCFNYYDGFERINLQELQAINEKVKELKWI